MTKLERVSNIAVIVAAVFFIGVTALDRLKQPASANNGRDAGASLLNKTLNVPAAANRGTEATLVLFFSKSCHYCAASMPFYRRLSGITKPTPGALKFIALSPKDTQHQGAEYLTQYSVQPDTVESADFMNLGVFSTPTLALMDGTGRIRNVWVGLLDRQKEDEVLRTIGRLCSKCQLN